MIALFHIVASFCFSANFWAPPAIWSFTYPPSFLLLQNCERAHFSPTEGPGRERVREYWWPGSGQVSAERVGQPAARVSSCCRAVEVRDWQVSRDPSPWGSLHRERRHARQPATKGSQPRDPWRQPIGRDQDQARGGSGVLWAKNVHLCDVHFSAHHDSHRHCVGNAQESHQGKRHLQRPRQMGFQLFWRQTLNSLLSVGCFQAVK